MPKLVVRRTGNSLALSLPREVVREFGISLGDQLLVHFERIPRMETLIGRLKGRLSASEFTKLSNEGEDLG